MMLLSNTYDSIHVKFAFFEVFKIYFLYLQQLGFIIFVGQLRLDNSTMNHLSSVHRKGESLVTYENKTVEMKADFEFSELVVSKF